jgi:hypothetical protein
MGQYVITIHGTGKHHNFKLRAGDPAKGERADSHNYLVQREDGRGYERTSPGDADELAREMVELLRKHGHVVTHAAFTVGGSESLMGGTL